MARGDLHPTERLTSAEITGSPMPKPAKAAVVAAEAAWPGFGTEALRLGMLAMVDVVVEEMRNSGTADLLPKLRQLEDALAEIPSPPAP